MHYFSLYDFKPVLRKLLLHVYIADFPLQVLLNWLNEQTHVLFLFEVATFQIQSDYPGFCSRWVWTPMPFFLNEFLHIKFQKVIENYKCNYWLWHIMYEQFQQLENCLLWRRDSLGPGPLGVAPDKTTHEGSVKFCIGQHVRIKSCAQKAKSRTSDAPLSTGQDLWFPIEKTDTVDAGKRSGEHRI